MGSSLLSVLADNFLSFDFIIFLLGGLNVFILIKTSIYSKQLYKTLNPYCWIPGGDTSLREIQEKFAQQKDKSSETDIIQLRRKMNTYYVIYENLTAIFPLLGLLGTVVSLLPMVGDMGEIVTGLFFSALTSTMWGIVFAIVFKALNGYLSSGIEDNEKNIEIYLQRNTERILQECGGEQKPVHMLHAAEQSAMPQEAAVAAKAVQAAELVLAEAAVTAEEATTEEEKATVADEQETTVADEESADTEAAPVGETAVK